MPKLKLALELDFTDLRGWKLIVYDKNKAHWSCRFNYSNGRNRDQCIVTVNINQKGRIESDKLKFHYSIFKNCLRVDYGDVVAHDRKRASVRADQGVLNIEDYHGAGIVFSTLKGAIKHLEQRAKEYSENRGYETLRKYTRLGKYEDQVNQLEIDRGIR